MACEIYISNSKETFFQFNNKRAEIDKIINDLEWMELPTKKASRIKKKTKGYLRKENKWTEYFEWLAKTAVQFQETFTKY